MGEKPHVAQYTTVINSASKATDSSYCQMHLKGKAPQLLQRNLSYTGRRPKHNADARTTRTGPRFEYKMEAVKKIHTAE